MLEWKLTTFPIPVDTEAAPIQGVGVGVTMLYAVAKHDKLAVVKVLLRVGADPQRPSAVHEGGVFRLSRIAKEEGFCAVAACLRERELELDVLDAAIAAPGRQPAPAREAEEGQGAAPEAAAGGAARGTHADWARGGGA